MRARKTAKRYIQTNLRDINKETEKLSPLDPRNILDEVSGPIDPNTMTNRVSVDPVIPSRKKMKMSKRPLNPVAAVDNPQATIETRRVMRLNQQTARYQVSLS